MPEERREDQQDEQRATMPAESQDADAAGVGDLEVPEDHGKHVRGGNFKLEIDKKWVPAN